MVTDRTGSKGLPFVALPWGGAVTLLTHQCSQNRKTFGYIYDHKSYCGLIGFFFSEPNEGYSRFSGNNQVFLILNIKTHEQITKQLKRPSQALNVSSIPGYGSGEL